MSLKITIEVDGQSEQQLAPVLSQLATRHLELKEQPPPRRPSFQASPAYLQQPPQPPLPRLAIQNDRQAELLSAQAASVQPSSIQMPNIQMPDVDTYKVQTSAPAAAAKQKRLVGHGPLKALSAARRKEKALDVQMGTAVASPQPERPRLPARYQLRPSERLSYRLRRLAERPVQRLWQALVWVAFGKAWLAITLLLGSGFCIALQSDPRLSRRFRQRALRAVPTLIGPANDASEAAPSSAGSVDLSADSFADGPGETIPAERASTADPSPDSMLAAPPSAERPTPKENSQEGSKANSKADSADETTLPIPAAPNGHHPPPPPAFQSNDIEYQER